MTTIRVPGRGEETYPVHIGALAETLRTLPPSAACMTDATIHAAHAGRLEHLLPADTHFIAPGEEGKSWDELQRAIAFLAGRGHQRSDPIVALGGGAVGDLAGLSAALYQRGCPVIQVPTTLLAMVDSSVGGKAAIDAEGQKNLVGAFHPPVAVHIDPAFLSTLDPRQMRAGVAETVKYGIIGDRAFYDLLTDGGLGARLLAREPEACTQAISTAVRAKATFVKGDLEDRTGRRALLNLGHSFGHAIEAVAGIGTLLHGEAVAIGMVMAADFSVHAGVLDRADARLLRTGLGRLDLPTRLDEHGLRAADLYPFMLADKKNDAGRINLVLLRHVGEAFLARDVDAASLRAFLEAY